MAAAIWVPSLSGSARGGGTWRRAIPEQRDGSSAVRVTSVPGPEAKAQQDVSRHSPVQWTMPPQLPNTHASALLG